MEFDILGKIIDIETIASSREGHIRRYLDRTYGKGRRRRKMKGNATVRFKGETFCEAEIHRFEAHGIGRRDFKIKRVIDEKFCYLH